MERIEIPLNRIKVSLFFLVNLCFTVLCIWLVSSLVIGLDESADIVFVILGSMATLVFISYCLKYLVVLLRLKSGLVISEAGIINNTGLIQWGIIEWDDIEDIVSWRERLGLYISLETYEHDKYADKVGRIMKWLILSNDDGFFMLNSPLISTWFLKGSSNEILTLVTDAWLKYSKNAKPY